jgi:hypothetical protein
MDRAGVSSSAFFGLGGSKHVQQLCYPENRLFEYNNAALYVLYADDRREFSIWRLALPNEAIPSSQQRVVGELLLHIVTHRFQTLRGSCVCYQFLARSACSVPCPRRQCTVAVD